MSTGISQENTPSAASQKGAAVEIQQLEPQPTLIIRATIPIDTLPAEVGERIPALISYIRQRGAHPAGPPFVRYHTFGEGETDMEVGIPVKELVAEEGRIIASELPGGPIISTWHYGPHDALGQAYARLQAWLDEQGREPDGPTWEVYHWIDPNATFDPSTWDPSTWGTQLIQPIKS